MEIVVDGKRQRQDGDEAMNRHHGSQGPLMKNIMRLVVVGSLIAITINVLMLLG
jgi:hypothetical protein